MFKTIKELFSLLTPSQRRRFYFLQILVVLMALAETAGVAAIGPFMMVVGDQTMLQGNGKMAWLYQQSGLNNPKDFLFYLGLIVLLVLILGSFVSVLATWKLSRFSNSVGAELSSRLFHHYMHQDWLFHTSQNSATLTSKVEADAQRITYQILTPLTKINARAVLALFLLLAVITYDPMVGLAGIATLVAGYLLIYRVVRSRLEKSGKAITGEQKKRYRLLSEGFGGIKDVLLLNRQDRLTQDFRISSENRAKRLSNVQILSQVPRYMVELVAFSALIFLSLYLIYSQEHAANNLLASLAVYGLAGFKLVPALQMVYSELTNLKAGLPAFESLREDLHACQTNEQPQSSTDKVEPKVEVKNLIELKDLSFTYPNKVTPALDEITLKIPVKKTIGLVGASGSGKSTAIDLLLGLLTPDKGQLLADGVEINKNNVTAWQKNLGYVPQSIFLSDASIRKNIAFGLTDKEIDDALVKKAIEQAHLTQVVSELPQGINTSIGERGVQLSGGQRQRIGIARALYSNANILVLDEATSALDGITEKLIMDSIHKFSGKKTIIMIAHRLATVKQCDIIYLMHQGKVLDRGSFDELVESSAVFREMTEHA